MSVIPTRARPAGPERSSVADPHDPAYQAFQLMRVGFTVVPVLFGLDKFFDVLVEWERYLAPSVADLLPGTPTQIMYAVGVVEIVAGVVVAVLPRFGGYLVAGWLAGIIGNLLIVGDYYDVALRDVALLLAAVTLARLATAFTPAGGRRHGSTH
jgi:hypothetical protein